MGFVVPRPGVSLDASELRTWLAGRPLAQVSSPTLTFSVPSSANASAA